MQSLKEKNALEKLSLREVQLASLEVLKELDEICKRYDIVYFLAYGTLLGAVRHHGYIPWDDDVDVWMPRDSYERFISIMNNHNMYPYKLCSRKNTDNYVYNIARFSSQKFYYKNIMPNERQFDCGVFVDVYPLDYFDDLKQAKEYEKSVQLLNKFYSAYVGNGSSRLGYKIARKMLYHFLHLLWGNRGSVRIEEIEKNGLKK